MLCPFRGGSSSKEKSVLFEFFIFSEGPYVRLMSSTDVDSPSDPVRKKNFYFISINSSSSSSKIWHWSHTSQADTTERQNRRQIQPQKYMLITVPGIGDVSNTVEP